MAQTRSPGEAGVSIEFVNHASFIMALRENVG